jgi:hypothetical protein
MEDILVKNCGNCPFCYVDFDPDSMGFDTLEYCLLSQFKQQDEYIIDVYDSHERQLELDEYIYDDNDEIIGTKSEPTDIKPTPEWCPLNNNAITIKHAE